MAGKGSPWKHCSAVVCHLDAFPHRDHFPNRFLHHRPVWPTFNVVNRDQNWSGNFPCHMRLHAPLSFVCTFIFGQLFDRKRRFEDSFVLFGENGEDASGNVMQQPFDTPWCPPPPVRGSRRAREQLVRCFEARGWGACWVCGWVSHALAPLRRMDHPQPSHWA